MDFEYWTDKNGTKWKVAEMPTGYIKTIIGTLKWQLRCKAPRVPALSDTWNTWLKIFTNELERREGEC